MEEKGVSFAGKEAVYSEMKTQPGKEELKGEIRKKISKGYRGAV